MSGGGAGLDFDLTAPSTGVKSRSSAKKLSAQSPQKSSLRLLTKVGPEAESPNHVHQPSPRVPRNAGSMARWQSIRDDEAHRRAAPKARNSTFALGRIAATLA